MRIRSWCAGVALASSLAPLASSAGVVNPDISVIGQPFATWSDDPASASRKRPVFDVGETEFVYDSALNPYARGYFTVSLADGAIDLEEGYFTLLRGLPAGLVLKGGKYRAGFGKLNPAHPHTYPFADRFHVLAAYLPGDESFDETGIDLSERVPVPGDWAVTASADVLQGDSFRIARNPSGAANDPLVAAGADGDRAKEPRAAWLGRLSAFAPIGDRSGLELGLSATQGTNNVAAAARTAVYGGDAKLKLWTSANAYLLLQGEALHLVRDDAGWNGTTAAYTLARVTPSGGYVFADFNWAQRYDAGASYEHWQAADLSASAAQAFGVFAGVALMEETTAFRIGFEQQQPPRALGAASDPPAVHAVTLRVLYSMGPHKAHQF